MDLVTGEEYWCRTTSGASFKSSITWTIENFRNRQEKFDEEIKSSIISVTDSDNRVTKWRVLVYPKGCKNNLDNLEYKECVSMFIVSLNESPVTASWEGWILDENTNIKHNKGSTGVQQWKGWGANGTCHSIGVPSFIEHSELTDSLLPKGNLTLVLKIIVFGQGKTLFGSKNPDNNILQHTHQRHEKLSHDLGQVLVGKEFSDIEIKCNETVFPCHQLILAARSPVFKAMIQAEMKEKQTKKIVIKDSNPRTVAEMLNFMYTGDILLDKLEEIVSDLLGVADKYELNDLKEMCEEKLCSSLSVENSIACLVLGDLHHASKLKKMALELVAKNTRKIVDTNVYKDLFKQKPALAWEVTKVKAMDEDI